LAPFSRASLKPIAIACFRLFTVAWLLPLFSVPCFFLCIARSTDFCAACPYRGMSATSGLRRVLGGLFLRSGPVERARNPSRAPDPQLRIAEFVP